MNTKPHALSAFGFGGMSTLLLMLFISSAAVQSAGLPMVTTEPLLALPLVFAAAAACEQRGFLRHAAALPCLFLAAAVLFVVFGLLLPQLFCHFCLLPLFYLFGALLFRREGLFSLPRLLGAIGMAQACAAPAFFFRLDKIPFNVVNDLRIWGLALYLFLAGEYARYAATARSAPLFPPKALCVGLLFPLLLCGAMLYRGGDTDAWLCLSAACCGTLLQGLHLWRCGAVRRERTLQVLLRDPLLPPVAACMLVWLF